MKQFQLQIRQAEISDVPKMHKVIAIAMTQYVRDSLIHTPLDSLSETNDDLKRYVQNDFFLLAFHGSEIVGTLRISNFNENSTESSPLQNFETGYISRFAVLPSVQNLGVGNALFKRAEEYLKESGYQHVILHTALKNVPLFRFYTKRGFDLVETKTDRGYERGTFVKTIIS